MLKYRENENRRSKARRATIQKILVTNILEDKPIGIVINIHNEGFMLLGSNELRVGRLYQVEFGFEKPVSGETSLTLGVQCLWRESAEMPGQAWLGFSIIDLSEKDSVLLDCLSE